MTFVWHSTVQPTKVDWNLLPKVGVIISALAIVWPISPHMLEGIASWHHHHERVRYRHLPKASNEIQFRSKRSILTRDLANMTAIWVGQRRGARVMDIFRREAASSKDLIMERRLLKYCRRLQKTLHLGTSVRKCGMNYSSTSPEESCDEDREWTSIRCWPQLYSSLSKACTVWSSRPPLEDKDNYTKDRSHCPVWWASNWTSLSLTLTLTCLTPSFSRNILQSPSRRFAPSSWELKTRRSPWFVVSSILRRKTCYKLPPPRAESILGGNISSYQAGCVGVPANCLRWLVDCLGR